MAGGFAAFSSFLAFVGKLAAFWEAAAFAGAFPWSGLTSGVLVSKELILLLTSLFGFDLSPRATAGAGTGSPERFSPRSLEARTTPTKQRKELAITRPALVS